MIEVRTEQDDVTIIAADRTQFISLRLAGGSVIRLAVSVGGDDRYHVSADLDRGQAVSFSAHDESVNLPITQTATSELCMTNPRTDPRCPHCGWELVHNCACAQLAKSLRGRLRLLWEFHPLVIPIANFFSMLRSHYWRWQNRKHFRRGSRR